MATDWVHIDTAHDMVNEEMQKRLAWQDVAQEFRAACEMDGFGGVKAVNFKHMTAAVEMYETTLKRYGQVE